MRLAYPMVIRIGNETFLRVSDLDTGRPIDIPITGQIAADLLTQLSAFVAASMHQGPRSPG